MFDIFLSNSLISGLSQAQKLQQYMYFLRLVLATIKQRSRLEEMEKKPPEKIRARCTEVSREILAFSGRQIK